jgi:3-oxoacyl-[acyl-carrier protein] reductase
VEDTESGLHDEAGNLKVALVTGASGGIGRAIALALAKAGTRIIIHYGRSASEADSLRKQIQAVGGLAETVAADVASPDGVAELAEQVRQLAGDRLDILVANAGIWNLEDLPIEKMSEKQWDDMIRINLKSIYSIIHFSVPQMIKQKSGKIITISSTAGQRGESLHTHYGASKGGIISFTKGLATELARHNILVNCVAPGWVATDMSNPVLETKAGQKMATTAIPLRRAGTAEEIAGPILFVASDLANFMTGEVINVNGGAVLCG